MVSTVTAGSTVHLHPSTMVITKAEEQSDADRNVGGEVKNRRDVASTNNAVEDDEDSNCKEEQSNLLDGKKRMQLLGGNVVGTDPLPPNVQAKMKYPRAVFLIVLIEFCERFSFYAMRTVLVLFLKDKLLLSENNATIIFHAFNMSCYLFPIVGGIIADSWLGKFRTILYLSLVYAVGNVVVALASWRALGLPGLPVTCVGLVLIAVGTGGIKPCVSSFGGDQFTLPQQCHHLGQFFSVFYFIANLGAMLATPEVRTLPCLGEDTCYPLAFGMPALLMVFFCGVFVGGERLYVRKDLDGNVLVQVTKCIGSAVWLRIEGNAPLTGAHWLDAAAPRFGEALVADVKVLLRLLVLAVPLPVFWALFNMQGSRWTFQARQLDGALGGWRLQADQMPVAGALFVVFLLPVFEVWLNPFLARRRILATPLQRMSVGGLMAAAAFLCTAVLQLNVERQADAAGHYGQVHILWQLPQYLFIAIAEIWFGIAVVKLGYGEAPASMKASITAIFQMTTAIGDIIVIVITGSNLFSDRTTEFFVYSGLMTVLICIFMYLASEYKSAAESWLKMKCQTSLQFLCHPKVSGLNLGNN